MTMSRRRQAATLGVALVVSAAALGLGPAHGKTPVRPRILGYRYDPPAAPGGQAAFEVDAVNSDGQVVGLRLGGDITLIADGGCGLGGRANGDPTHFRVPVPTLDRGDHTITITVSASSCDAAARVAAASQTVTLNLPGNAGTGAHPRCDSVTTMRLVRRFTRALTTGDRPAADRSFAREPAFQWYSTGAPGARLRAASHNRRTLRAYLRRRVEQHERLRLQLLTARYEIRRDLGNFHGTLVRSADDLQPTSYGFKGAATCARGQARIIVWSMAAHRR